MPVGLLARPRADRRFVGVVTVRSGPWLSVEAGKGKGAGVLQDRRDQGEEGGPRGRGAHRAEQSDGGMDQLADKGGGNRQGERALHLDKIGTVRGAAGDLLAAAPILSANTLARILGIAVKNAIPRMRSWRRVSPSRSRIALSGGFLACRA
jgi:hypothetical protein